ncbi:MAG TPA: glucosamine-6-phosphate deaminase [Acidimicrobiia bacterium]|nr:glucosamine-6-phosphate deaminase [Acidimicrobiia bacterium]
MSLQVEIQPDDVWAGTLADRFAKTVRKGARLCLATGSTVAPFYRAVAEKVSLGGVTLFLLDEFGGLPGGDPGRCETMIRRDLLSRASGRPRFRLPDIDAADPHREAGRYGDLIDDGGLDLAIVGLGMNGHIGMNEPGSTPDLTTRVVDLDPITSETATTYGATDKPTWGITVGMAELLRSRELWLLVTGSHKREILRRTLDDPIGPDVPASFLRNHPNATLVADESALG